MADVTETSRPTKTQNAPAPRLEFIDGLRALAMLQVLLFHCWSLGGQWRVDVPLGRHHFNLCSVFSVGHVGVSLFLVLSGFCLYWPFAQGNGRREPTLWEFARKRCRRILPPYYVALLLFAGWDAIQIAAGSGGEGFGALARSVGLHLVMLQNLRPETFYDINGSFWSLALECHLYVLFPLLVEAGRRWGMRPVLLAVLAASTAFRLLAVATGGGQANVWTDVLTYSVFGRIFEFTLGMFAASVVSRPAGDRGLTRRDIAGGGALLLAMLACHKLGLTEVIKAALSGLAFTALLLAAARAGTPLHRLLSSRPMVRLGVISYSVYLVHQPLAVWFGGFTRTHGFSGAQTAAFELLFVVPCLLLLGYIFHLAFERPFLTTRARTPSAPGLETPRPRVLGAGEPSPGRLAS